MMHCTLILLTEEIMDIKSTKKIQSVKLDDEYYPCIPPSYIVNITYADNSVGIETKSAVDVYKEYKSYLSAHELNRVKDALRRIPWNIGFDIEPNEPTSSVQSRYNMWNPEADIFGEPDEPFNEFDNTSFRFS